MLVASFRRIHTVRVSPHRHRCPFTVLPVSWVRPRSSGFKTRFERHVARSLPRRDLESKEETGVVLTSYKRS